jgi:hypothetical protein
MDMNQLNITYSYLLVFIVHNIKWQSDQNSEHGITGEDCKQSILKPCSYGEKTKTFSYRSNKCTKHRLP